MFSFFGFSIFSHVAIKIRQQNLHWQLIKIWKFCWSIIASDFKFYHPNSQVSLIRLTWMCHSYAHPPIHPSISSTLMQPLSLRGLVYCCPTPFVAYTYIYPPRKFCKKWSSQISHQPGHHPNISQPQRFFPPLPLPCLKNPSQGVPLLQPTANNS